MALLDYRLFFSFLLLVTVNSCIKIEPSHAEAVRIIELPEATHIGANTFGCYINGELFLTEDTYWVDTKGISLSFNSISKDELRIRGTRSNDTIYDYIGFTAFVNRTGEVPIMVWEDHTTGYSSYSCYYGHCEDYYYKENEPYTLNITYLDTIKRIIAGTFEFDLIGKKCDDEIMSITDGRFDLTY